MTKSLKKNVKIVCILLIFSGYLLFFTLHSDCYLNARKVNCSLGKVNPESAQTIPLVISCDVKNGENYSADQILSINWTISGYINYQYLLKENGAIQDFGTIYANQSYIINQLITPTNGWHVFSIVIRNQTQVLAETSIVIEIITNVPLWLQSEFWFIIVAGIASVSTVTNIVLWRRTKNSGTLQRDPNFLVKRMKHETRNLSSNISSPLGTDIIPTRNGMEEKWFTFISTTRVEKAWWFDTKTLLFIQTKLIRRELWEQNRESGLDQALFEYLNNCISPLSAIGVPQFAVIHSMREREHLLWIRIGDASLLALLLDGRVTNTYLTGIIGVCEELGALQKSNKEISSKFFFDALEAHLKISRSFSHIEAGEETIRVLKASKVPGLLEDPKILEDARGLTPSECAWILQKAKELQDTAPSDSVLDEVEHLS